MLKWIVDGTTVKHHSYLELEWRPLFILGLLELFGGVSTTTSASSSELTALELFDSQELPVDSCLRCASNANYFLCSFLSSIVILCTTVVLQ